MPDTEDESVTHIERAVRVHASLEDLKDFLACRASPGAFGVLTLSHITVGQSSGVDVMIPTGMVVHHLAKRVLRAAVRIARNEASSATRVPIRVWFKDVLHPNTLHMLIEAMPLSLSEREDIDALKE
jgi:hypothetical protein